MWMAYPYWIGRHERICHAFEFEIFTVNIAHVVDIASSTCRQKKGIKIGCKLKGREAPSVEWCIILSNLIILCNIKNAVPNVPCMSCSFDWWNFLMVMIQWMKAELLQFFLHQKFIWQCQQWNLCFDAQQRADFDSLFSFVFFFFNRTK